MSILYMVLGFEPITFRLRPITSETGLPLYSIAIYDYILLLVERPESKQFLTVNWGHWICKQDHVWFNVMGNPTKNVL